VFLKVNISEYSAVLEKALIQDSDAGIKYSINY
jgi:hypothetical protein